MRYLKIISFGLSGDFAAFSDPSVTSNQTVYFIPSKSAVIGLIGALIGIRRDYVNYEWYSKDFWNLFAATKIGIDFESEPSKFTYFTNNVSLKSDKKKPFKRDVLLKPKYKLYVSTSDEYRSQINKALKGMDFAFSPYLGNAFCPARIQDRKEFDAEYVDPNGKTTRSIILDESESYKPNFKIRLQPVGHDDSRIIIERHLHHFFEEIPDKKTGQISLVLNRRALKHWIPIGNSEFRIKRVSDTSLSKFFEMEGRVVCLY